MAKTKHGLPAFDLGDDEFVENLTQLAIDGIGDGDYDVVEEKPDIHPDPNNKADFFVDGRPARVSKIVVTWCYIEKTAEAEEDEEDETDTDDA